MNEYIAYCGLDCETCEARLATVNNDDALRRRVEGPRDLEHADGGDGGAGHRQG